MFFVTVICHNYHLNDIIFVIVHLYNVIIHFVEYCMCRIVLYCIVCVATELACKLQNRVPAPSTVSCQVEIGDQRRNQHIRVDGMVVMLTSVE